MMKAVIGPDSKGFSNATLRLSNDKISKILANKLNLKKVNDIHTTKGAKLDPALINTTDKYLAAANLIMNDVFLDQDFIDAQNVAKAKEIVKQAKSAAKSSAPTSSAKSAYGAAFQSILLVKNEITSPTSQPVLLVKNEVTSHTSTTPVPEIGSKDDAIIQLLTTMSKQMKDMQARQQACEAKLA